MLYFRVFMMSTTGGYFAGGHHLPAADFLVNGFSDCFGVFVPEFYHGQLSAGSRSAPRAQTDTEELRSEPE